jgi:hypothetical protein
MGTGRAQVPISDAYGRRIQGGDGADCIVLQRFSRVERVTGIEPALSAWEADVLPLNYTRRGADRHTAQARSAV